MALLKVYYGMGLSEEEAARQTAEELAIPADRAAKLAKEYREKRNS